MVSAVADAIDDLATALHVTIRLVPAPQAGRAGQRAAGAEAAAAAFTRAGAAGLAIVGHEDDGRPRWPPGWTGSVSHAAGLAVAVVVPVVVHAMVGIDLDVAGALPLGDAELVLDEHERQAAERDVHRLPTLLWSAKESAFKAWATASDGLANVDPRQLHVEVAGEALSATWAPMLPLRGRWVEADGVLITVLVGG